MSFNKNSDDIIDAEFVIDGKQKSSTESQGSSSSSSSAQNSQTNQFIRQYQFNADQYAKQDNFSAQSFAWSGKNKKGSVFPKPNFLVLLLLSPIILVLFTFGAVIFLFAFILFMPKIIRMIRLMKNKRQFVWRR